MWNDSYWENEARKQADRANKAEDKVSRLEDEKRDLQLELEETRRFIRDNYSNQELENLKS